MSDVEQISGENEIKINKSGIRGPPTTGRLQQSSCQLQTTIITPTIKQYKQQQHQHHQKHLLNQQRQKQKQKHHHHHQHHYHQQKQQQQEENKLHPENPSVNSVGPGDSLVDTAARQKHLNWFSKALQVTFSTPGLVVLVVMYSVMGAIIFPLLETPQDIRKSIAIAKSREDCLRELWIITEKLNVLYERNWTMLVHEQLRRFEGSIVAATRNGIAGENIDSDVVDDANYAGATSSLSIGEYETVERARWSFSEALLYSVTVITTIGHGSLTPRTAGGKIATILYALIGVPLMLMCLSSLGGLLAEALQCTYTRICSVISGRHRCHRRRCSKDSDSGAESVCHGQSHEMDCKSCKYDPVAGETNLNNRYEYGNRAGNEREDSCQLLHSSPINKLNHSSPCMQLKSSLSGPSAVMFGPAMVNAAQHVAQPNVYHMQQQQQQQQQQQPDVMLMTAGVKNHHLQPYHQYQQQQQQQHHQSPQQNPSAGSTCTSPHPQAYFMQTVCHSNGSALSPTPSMREYQEQQPHRQQQQQQQQPKQQAAALPNNVVRLNNACNVIGVCAGGATIGIDGGSPGTGSGRFVGNYCSNTSRPSTDNTTIPGTATIYFPITAATTTMPCLGVGVTGIRVAPSPPIHYNHPMVKYHTIQLQQRKVFDHSGMNTMRAASIPPPPYQTATVHGIRRAKFLTKPMPQEINTLLAESDISCRHDLSGNTTATSLSSSSVVTSSNGGGGGGGGSGSSCTSTTAMADTSGNPPVDIMEDEEEHEQNRVGNCPHGTPSRVPLISSGKSGNIVSSGSGAGSQTSVDCDTENIKTSSGGSNNGGGGGGGGGGSGMLGQRRGTIMISSTVGNRQQQQQRSHPLNTFRESINGVKRKTNNSCGMNPVNRKGGVGGCYGGGGGDTTTEDDDDDDYDDDDDDDDEDYNDDDENYRNEGNSEGDVIDTGESGGDGDDGDGNGDDDDQIKSKTANCITPPQVPITVVFLILICYICLGTVIFAFWENWSFIDGAYFCFVTLSTIGYGDFIPEQTFHGPEMQLFACCAYLLLGLVLVAMSFSILETQLLWKCRRIAVRLKLAKD